IPTNSSLGCQEAPVLLYLRRAAASQLPPAPQPRIVIRREVHAYAPGARDTLLRPHYRALRWDDTVVPRGVLLARLACGRDPPFAAGRAGGQPRGRAVTHRGNHAQAVVAFPSFSVYYRVQRNVCVAHIFNSAGRRIIHPLET